MVKADVVLAFDVGTSAVKAAAYETGGKCLFRDALTYPNTVPAPGCVEQDPQSWLRCIRELSQRAFRNVRKDTVKAIGVCSQVNTHVFVDSAGEALMNAFVWQDQRCAEVAEALNLRASNNGAGDVHFDASALVSRAEWVRLHRPEIWDKTRWILSPKDYVCLSLTGEAVSDSLSSIGLVDLEGTYQSGLIDIVPGLGKRLPPLGDITQVAGKTKEPPFPQGCPVVVCTMDAWASLFGSGATHSGDAFQVAGTSEIIGLLSDQSFPGTAVVTFPRFNDLYLHAGPTQAAGDALKWFAEMQGMSIGAMLELAQQAAQEKEPLIFLPHLMGERAPLWNSSARGVFVGLTKRHTLADMAKAVLRGVGFSARQLLEEVEVAAGRRCITLRISGGGSQSDLWCQIKSDIAMRSLERVEDRNTGTMGAGMIAAVGASLYSGLEEASNAAVRIDRHFQPNQSAAEWNEALYQLYRDTYKNLLPVFEKYSQFTAAHL